MKKFLIIALLISLPINGRTFYKRVTYKQQIKKDKMNKENKSHVNKGKLSKEEILKRLSDLMFDKDQMQKHISLQYKCEIPEDLRNEMLEVMHNKFNEPETTKSIQNVFVKHFTDSELEDLLNFYESPTGKKSIKTMPAIAIEIGQIGMKKKQEITEELKPKLDNRLLKNNDNLVK